MEKDKQEKTEENVSKQGAAKNAAAAIKATASTRSAKASAVKSVEAAKSPSAATRTATAAKTSAAVAAAKVAATKSASMAKTVAASAPKRAAKTAEDARIAASGAKSASTATRNAAVTIKPAAANVNARPSDISVQTENAAEPSFAETNGTARGYKDGKKKKGVVITVASVVAILLFSLAFLATRGVWLGGGNANSAKARENTLALVQKYIDKGQYDDAMRLLDTLLQADINDKEADELLDKAIALKKEAEAQNAAPQGANFNFDTDEIASALREQNERNQETISRLLEEQQRRNDEILSARQEESAIQQKAAEEQRKKEEAERKRKEDEIVQANKAIKGRMDAINEKILAGKAELNTGNIDSALSSFSAVAENLPLGQGEPDFSALKYSELASTLYDAAQNEKDPERKEKLNKAAISYVDKALSANPNDPASHYIRGMNFIDDGNWENAQKELSAAVKNDPNNHLYCYDLGRAQYRLGNFAQARSSFETATKLKKDFDSAHFNLGMTYQRLKLNKDALAAFRSAHQVNPSYYRAYLEEARILNGAFNDSKGALDAYKKVIELDPVNTQALNECGSVYAGMGNYSEAENCYRRAIALLKPGDKDPITYYNLATALFNQNKVSEARGNAKTAYEQMDALRRNSDKAMVVYNYALIEDTLGNADKAITLYKEVLILDPNNAKTKTNLGVMFMNMDPPDADTALAFFLDAYKTSPSFELENNLGSAYLVKKDYSNAITYFQNAIKKSPRDNTVRFNLAQAYSGAGDFDNAKTTYLEILNSDTSNWDTYIEVAKVYMALKDTANAEAYLKILQQKNPTYKKAEVDALLAAAQ